MSADLPAAPGGPDGVLTIDGREVGFRSGQTVAAALLADGVRSWRRTRGQGRPRGLFCGIGACFDCLVVLNGTPGVRACLAEACDGDVVAVQHGTGPEPTAGST